MPTDPSATRPAAPWALEARLRSRLLLMLVGLWLAGALVALIGLREGTGAVLDSALAETAQRLLVLPEAALDNAEDYTVAGGMREDDEYVIYQVFDAAGHLRLRSHKAPQAPLAPTAADGMSDHGRWRVHTLTRVDGQRRVHVAESQARRGQVLWTSGLWLIAPLLALLPIAALVLHLVLRAGFRTLERARLALAELSAHEPRHVSVNDMPLELQPLLETVNSLMARVQMLVDAERAFTARTAHELRTPLAAARAQAQRLLKDATEAGFGDKAQMLLRQLDRITTLATRLLQLARIESGVALRREPVDLALLCRVLVDEFAQARRTGKLTLELPEIAPMVQGDVDALGIALRNLIDNALKHAGAAARVSVRVGPSCVSVTDNGPGVATEELARLVRPFERGTVVADGSGLGLSMVETIARQSGARLELRSPVQGTSGFEATLRFAAAA
ncbi:MAG: HAMP domain-containing histidine kinase [Burkholderiaceae bacterium]|nr:HAMP domain-containing histidine kinase [Burkholderiaceae bacterium]